jgi:type II secretory pathway component PulF
MSAVAALLGRFNRGDELRAQRRALKARQRFRRSPGARLAMWQALATLLDHHDLVESLQIVWEAHSEQGLKPNTLLAMVAESWIPRIRAPEPFADVIKGAVSEREQMIISIGQDRQRLAPILRDLHHSENLLQEIAGRWKGSLRQPFGMIAVSWATVVWVSSIIADQVATLPVRPRGYALTAYHAALWLVHYGSWLLPLIAISVLVTILWSFEHWLGATRTRLDLFWPWSLFKRKEAADFLTALHLLQNAGEDISSSLLAMLRTAPPYLRWQITAIEPLSRKKPLGFALRQTGRRFPDAGVNAVLDVAQRDQPRNFPDHLKRECLTFTEALMRRMEESRQAVELAALLTVGLLQIIALAISSASAIQ